MPGPAVIDYRGLAAPAARGVGGIAVIGAVSATGALMGSASAQAPSTASSSVGSLAGAASTVTPTAASAYTSMTLYPGARGAAVSYLQKQLNAAGAGIAVDGRFGPATARAVRSVQTSANIRVNTIVGPQTWGALSAGTKVGSTQKSSSSTGNPVLKQGARGAAVRTLQTKLNEAGAGIAVDGSFGPGTARAVRAFQAAAGLAVDTSVGPATWRALNAGGTSVNTPAPQAPAPSTSTGNPVLKQGARGAAVRTLQTKLNEAGAGIAVDGRFGPGTARAVRAFQAAAGLAVDTSVGPATWRALNAGGTKITAPGDTSTPSKPAPSSPSSGIDGEAVVAAARNYLGVRYTWGGTTASGGFDCSGLVYRAYNDAGIAVPRKGVRGYTFDGRVVPRSQAEPGDMVVFTNNNYAHMGIYVGNGRIIDASYSRQRVIERQIWNEPHIFVKLR